MAEKEGMEIEGGISLGNLPFTVPIENPGDIKGIAAVDIQKEANQERLKALFSDGYTLVGTYVLLGMSEKFPQTNYHKVVAVLVKR